MRTFFTFVVLTALACAGTAGYFFFKYPDSDFSRFLGERRFKSAADEAVRKVAEYVDDFDFCERIFVKPQQDPEVVGNSEKKDVEENAEKKEPKPETPAFPPPRKLDGVWFGIGEESYCSGPRLSTAKMKDAVVLVYLWDCEDPQTARLMRPVENIWRSFKHKNFKVVASNVGAKTAKTSKAAEKCTFSVYDHLSHRSFSRATQLPCIYVVTSSGRIITCSQNHRMATQVVVSAFAEQFERSKSKRK